MSTAADVFDEIPPAWRVAFEEAWESWRTGNFGVGAVLVDPPTGAVVSTGRNRVARRVDEPGTVSGHVNIDGRLPPARTHH